MKRLSIILVFFLGINMIFAQTGVRINFDQLKKKVEKSNEDIQNPKKNIKEGTWLSRADLMMEIYESQILNTRTGMNPQEFMLLAGQPKERIQEEKDGNLIEKFITERAIFYFTNNQLVRWELLNPVIENPLDSSLKSLNKALEIDQSGKKTKDIKIKLDRLRGNYLAEGLNCYYSQKYDLAYYYFSKLINIGLMPQLNYQDTAVYYYSGLAAQYAGKNSDAVNNFKKAIDFGYFSDGNVYSNIYESYKALGENDSIGLNYLNEGFAKYPQNKDIMYSLINHYITKKEDPSKIITLIDKAIADEPTNKSLYLVKGSLYEKLNQSDAAIATYQEAIKIDSLYFEAYYTIGALYFNRGVSLNQESLQTRDLKKIDELDVKANTEFKNSLPYMVKAYQVKPTDKDAVEALKNLYFRFRQESPEMQTKYDEFSKLYDETVKSTK